MVGGEINEIVDRPWLHAICTMYQLINIDANHDYRTGIPWSILNSGEFELVIWRPNPETKYPEPQSAKNGLYIVGLTGKIRSTESDRIKWEIRYDWDPAKRYHVNLQVTTSKTTVYSFNCMSYGAQDARESFKMFLRSARSATLISTCYNSTPWAENALNAWLHINELTPVAREDEITKKRYAYMVWEGLFKKGRRFEDNWKELKERGSTTEIQTPFKAAIRFDKSRKRSVEPEIREYWITRVRQYLQDRQECFGLALISGSGAPESSDSGEYLEVRLYGDLEGKQLMKKLRVDTHADPLGTPYDSTQLYPTLPSAGP